MGIGGRILGAATAMIALSALSVADGNIVQQKRQAEFAAAAMARADTWYRQTLQYSQDGCYRLGTGYAATDWSTLGGCHPPYYRTDCSGFVSMAWNLPHSYATPRPGPGQDLGDLTEQIPKDQLSKGDALVAPGKHVRLFEKWLNTEQTRYRAYDFGSTPVKHQDYIWGAAGEYEYTPVRYVRATTA
ncbi:hypothetical protein JOF56_005572 [Kibdelosporangium banguiense]|uniref:Cell wall-associated hydrolase, NlpC family n=1 Tax=Kibdelosporangium banguiense TaxID=1365924 RepID=A0ABS4TL78_9PSEU|nr:hypothetical protein [Kibdelosporangium banguiense]MBP2325187.1 hypothetical protein [Kibdelosporangium banguiense]